MKRIEFELKRELHIPRLKTKDVRVKMTTVLRSINPQHHQHQIAKVTAKSSLIKTEIRDIKSHKTLTTQIMFTYPKHLANSKLKDEF